ncbi:hypothetical protein COLO4_26575 [Corchorus olitorius]|uniref:Uncharacterized protein n=1 Tax=Corchorus olitorius TaxID=93759 RepID=A0A1R3HWF4_9ROSI|nr:hypothetical protein COLO4_26575 [Corchorus olitorius]
MASLVIIDVTVSNSAEVAAEKEIDMILVEELNYKEVSFEMGSKIDNVDLDENDYEEVNSVKFGLLDNPTAPNDSPMELATLDNKKKKRAKHNWSRKKSHSKVVNGTPCAPEILEDDNYISDEDTHFRNNMFRREAVETLKIGQLLGLTFKDKDENIINKLVALEYEDWKMHSIN